MNIWRGAACVAVVLVPAQIAWAGEQPLYEPAPGWVTVAKLPDTAAGSAVAGPVLYDVQQRVDGATVWNYVDTALKLDTPEALSQSSNLTLAWAPDKGDLIIHQVAIIRNGEEIDALAGGQKFTVLRREQALEQRELTGILSATLAVEGLRVGDVLRVRMSTTVKDAALGGRAQLALPLIAEPAPIKAASYKLSWRTGDATQWKVLSGNVDAKPKRAGEFSELPIVMPIAKLTEIPQDAPGRFQRLPLIEASTFASWADVSKIMAPLYATDGTIAAGSALAGEVATIKTATDDPLKRTAMALQLVQDKVRYLAVGMDGGNYVPQTPAKTWDVRYGDCKAKTLLLLAILHAMDIEAEAVLAHADMGELVERRIPSALAFNHVIVGAKVGGETLWLDGTGLGARLADIRDTPPFGHVLPVRTGGAELVKIALRAPARPIVDLTLDADESTSVDLPSVIDLTMVVRGQLASLMTLASSQLGAKEQRELTEKFLQHYVGEAQYDALTTTTDAEAGSITIKGKGVFTTGWRRDDQRMERWMSRSSSMIGFEPDRARASWADIPVATAAPDLARYRMRIRLPDGGRGYTIEGDPAVYAQVAGYDVKRTASMEGGVVTVDEWFATAGREIPAAQIAAERDRAVTLLARAPRMVAPADARRRWNLKGAGSVSQLEAASAIFAKAAAEADEENVTALTSSASFHQGICDYKGAIAALTKQIALLPSVDAYLSRSAVRKELGDIAGALADAEEARKLDPASQGAVFSVAMLIAERCDVAKASAMLD